MDTISYPRCVNGIWQDVCDTASDIEQGRRLISRVERRHGEWAIFRKRITNLSSAPLTLFLNYEKHIPSSYRPDKHPVGGSHCANIVLNTNNGYHGTTISSINILGS